MKKKANRLDAIKMIISSKEVGSQEELLQELNREGFELTQPPSRDLKQLKVAKAASMNGKYVYVLPNNIMYKRSTDQSAGEMLRNNGFISFSFPVTSPLSVPVPVMPAAWLMISTTMNSVKFWEPLPATIPSCWFAWRSCNQVKYVSFVAHHSEYRITIPIIIYKKMDTQQIDVMVADASHEVYVDTILETIRNAAAVRGTGIAERTHEYVATKMKEGKSNYCSLWRYLPVSPTYRIMGKQAICSNSGLIVHPDFRGLGLAKRIKQASFQLARSDGRKLKFSVWPPEQLWWKWTPNWVMSLSPSTNWQTTKAFWKGCEGCINHDILVAKNRKFCICTAMLYDPTDPRNIKKNKKEITFKRYSTMEEKKKK